MRIGLGTVQMCKCCDGSVVVQVRIWTFRVSASVKCHATRCWPSRERCYKCDAPRDTVPNNPPMGPLGRAPPQSRSSGLPTRSSGPRHVPPRNKGNGNEPPPVAGVGPGSAGTEVGKKGDAGELM